MAAAARLVQKGGGEVQGCFTIIELSDLEVTNSPHTHTHCMHNKQSKTHTTITARAPLVCQRHATLCSSTR